MDSVPHFFFRTSEFGYSPSLKIQRILGTYWGNHMFLNNVNKIEKKCKRKVGELLQDQYSSDISILDRRRA